MRNKLLRRNSPVFPYVRAAAFHRPKTDQEDAVEFSKSVLAYFAASDFSILQFLVRAVEGSKLPEGGA